MVQLMDDNFNQYSFVNCRTTMATGDKQEPISTKKLALKDHVPNETRNNILKSPGNSPLQKDTTKVSGLKRLQPSSPSGPARPQPLGTNGTNGLVYVRRKFDTEPRKMNPNNSVVSPVKISISDCKKEPNLQSEISQKAEISMPQTTTSIVPSGGSSPSHSIAKSIDELHVPLSNCSRAITTIPNAVPLKPRDELPVPFSNCSRVTSAIPDAVLLKTLEELPVPSSNCSKFTTAIPNAVPLKLIDELPVPSSDCSGTMSAIPDAVPVKPSDELPIPLSNCSSVTTAVLDAVPVKPINELPVPSSNCSGAMSAILDAVPVRPIDELLVPSSNCSRFTTAILDAAPVKPINELPVPSSNCSRVATTSPNSVPLTPTDQLPVHLSNCTRVPTAIPNAVPIQPIDEPAVPSSNCSGVTNSIPDAVPVQPEALKPRDYWKERFGRLQMFLKSCDESSQEEYIQRLRSLSAAGRSRHAYDLEKRAIQLTLDEGKELNRMADLNVFGKSPDQNSGVNSQTHSSLKVVQND